MNVFNKFPNIIQADDRECGIICIKILCKYYNKEINNDFLYDFTTFSKDGLSLLDLNNLAKKNDFKTSIIKCSFSYLQEQISLPCIILWDQCHYVIVYRITKKRVYISDPSLGLISYRKDDFVSKWAKNDKGYIIELRPSFKFKNRLKKKKSIYNYTNNPYINFLLTHKKDSLQILLGILCISFFSFVIPFITKNIIDIGILNKDIGFIYFVFFAQAVLLLGSFCADIFIGWLLMILGTKINVSLISEFLEKILSLPTSFFNKKKIGNLIETIDERSRIESFFTNSLMNILFNIPMILLFSFIIAYYSLKIFLFFLIGSCVYIIWISLFMNKRKIFDFERFKQISSEKNKIIELINGIKEIKVYNAENEKKGEWNKLQKEIFNLRIRSLKLNQYQTIGASFINNIKNLCISFFSAYLVIKGDLSLGVMISIQYIIGQINIPLSSLVNHLQKIQDANISFNRIKNINTKKNEWTKLLDNPILLDDINFKNVSFKYTQSKSYVLKNINLTIPLKKTTAIVGVSGSGKTTLLNLIMKFYENYEGGIYIGNKNILDIPNNIWRECFGVVLQDGYIFSDTIEKNIAMIKDKIDSHKIDKICEIVNLKSYIFSLPSKYKTKIGNEGMQMSGGQKQRLLIARALYKESNFIFFDEATSSLDTENEKNIIENINNFYSDKTIIIIAHRLSTVKNADQIVVIDKGEIIEVGKHEELIQNKKKYYNLIRNQLELQ